MFGTSFYLLLHQPNTDLQTSCINMVLSHLLISAFHLSLGRFSLFTCDF